VLGGLSHQNILLPETRVLPGSGCQAATEDGYVFNDASKVKLTSIVCTL